MSGAFLRNYRHLSNERFAVILQSKLLEMNTNRLLLGLPLIFAAFFLQSCDTEAQTQTTSIREVSAEEAASMLENDEAIQLVDVRTQGEVAQGYIEGAEHIDYMKWNVFTAGVETLDKDQPVMVYCKVGGRSHKAAEYLLEKGFTKVYDLKGGILAWNKENKPLKTD